MTLLKNTLKLTVLIALIIPGLIWDGFIRIVDYINTKLQTFDMFMGRLVRKHLKRR